MATAISTKIDFRELISKLADMEYKLDKMMELLQDAIVWEEGPNEDCLEEPQASDQGGLFGEDGNLESAECRALHMGGGYETDDSSSES